MLDASPITRYLSVGGAPEPGFYGARFDVVVLVSKEYQPRTGDIQGVVVRRYPFDDSLTPTRGDLRTAWEAATTVANDVMRGRRVLVTCSMGRNRSALVAALALHMVTGMSGERAMKEVQARRVDRLGVRALSNPAFRGFLRAQR